MKRVKSEVAGCGGNSHIVLIGRKGTIETLSTRRIMELEIHHKDVETEVYDNFAKELLKELP